MNSRHCDTSEAALEWLQITASHYTVVGGDNSRRLAMNECDALFN